ncbi:sulfatase-like hydrolase/transferase [Sphingobacteruim zhuxiongii]|nr:MULTISPECIES: sulfatase-like hydrolase/transferase [unclassified Sphingobacterium]
MKKTLLICIVSFVPFLQTLAQSAESRPNILWIVSEDNSPFIGAYGDIVAHTPNIDGLAEKGLLFNNAYCTAAVCAPSRSTLITGMYPASLGTENMRSSYPVPDFVKFFPKYLREAGYYTSNNAKKDYNSADQIDAWDESSKTATYQNRKNGQPFFAVFNIEISHESSIFGEDGKAKMRKRFGLPPEKEVKNSNQSPRHNAQEIKIPAYLPKTPEMLHDWALYYDKIEEMDYRVGELLQQLKKDGLDEETIVFYYADNGGVLGRSKRFMYESGLHIPLVVHIPEKYKNLNPYKQQNKINRLVDFTDFAPTVLQLAGVNIPDYFQGKPFLGATDISQDKDYAFGSRGRMDERIDLVRTIRSGNYRYVRNFMPHRPYGQHLNFLWLASSIQSWEKAFKEGKLTEVQARFFKPKPTEELYDIAKDPDNIHNLATDPNYKAVLEDLRKETKAHLLTIKDVGFIPESAIASISGGQPLYDFARSGNYNLTAVIERAYLASSNDETALPTLLKGLNDQDPLIRYWSATGLLILNNQSVSTSNVLRHHLYDDAPYVRLVIAEQLYKSGFFDAIEVLASALDNQDPMVRIQALNSLQETRAEHLKPYHESIKRISENKDSEYELNLANYLLESKFNENI